VKLLKAGLEAHGCTVWYDRERLHSGMDFGCRIEDAVKKHCALFLSLISRHTESQAEAYFHRERNWAAERAQSYSDHDREDFYHPVVIDDLDLGTIVREPRLFSGCHRSQLPGGIVTPEFGQRLLALQRKHGGPHPA